MLGVGCFVTSRVVDGLSGPSDPLVGHPLLPQQDGARRVLGEGVLCTIGMQVEPEHAVTLNN